MNVPTFVPFLALPRSKQSQTLISSFVPLSTPRFIPRSHPKCIQQKSKSVVTSNIKPPLNPTSSDQTVTCTWLGYNTFLLRHADITILIDPFLCGDAVINQPEFYTLSHLSASSSSSSLPFDPSTLTAVILTQSTADHTHPLTLASFFLPTTPIIALSSVRPILSELGFLPPTTRYVTPGDEVVINSSVTVKTFKGTPTPPSLSFPWCGLAALVKFSKIGKSVYIEPHNYHEWRQLKKNNIVVDAVIVPFVTSFLKTPLSPLSPLFDYNFLDGVNSAVRLCAVVNPKVCVGFDTRCDIMTGSLMEKVRFVGEANELVEKVKDLGKDIQVITDLTRMNEFVIV